MAIFYMRASIVRAGSGKSAVASAAYQAAQSLYDKKLNRTFSYSRKEEVLHSEILLPAYAPKHFGDRETLWNAVEDKESRTNSRYARQLVIATPREWTAAEAIERIRCFIQKTFVEKGMCADWAFHDKDNNPHVHIMLTIRGFRPDGSWDVMERNDYALDENGERIPEIDPQTGQQKIRKRTRNGIVSCEKIWKREVVQANNWNKKEFLYETKQAWAELCNRYLEPEHQIDWRSYKQQGKNRIPLVHEGPSARGAWEKGMETYAVRENRERRKLNSVIEGMEQFILSARSLLQELRKRLEKWREIHGQRRNASASELIAGNGRVAPAVPGTDSGNTFGAGAGRPIQEILKSAAELSRKAEHLRHHKHRR